VSLWDAITGRRRVKLSLDSADGWNVGASSKSGQSVTPETTMGLSAAWACVRLRARVVGALPVGVFERSADGERAAAKDHWLYRLVHDSPNADQTSAEYWGGQVGCMDLHGNGYSFKDRLRDRVVALNPLRPEAMTVRRTSDGDRKFHYSDRGHSETYSEDEIFHLKGFTVGGDVGLSAVAYGRHSLGIGLAADETAAKTFANGLQVSGFVEMLQGVRMSKKQREELVELFEKFTGSSRAGKVMPLDGGMKFVPLTMNPQDAQLLETRAFNIEEICRWFDTPPVLIGHAGEGQTMWGSGIEQIMLAWLTTGLDPLLTGIQQAIGKQLLSATERQRFYAEFNREGLLRADSKGRAEMYSKLFQVAAVTPNMIADRENFARFEGGDRRFVNATYVPIETAGKVKTQPAAGEPV
jgi:HK97 family phage portal protein